MNLHVAITEPAPHPRYAIDYEAELGEGGYGIVYRAVDQETREFVAAKCLKCEPHKVEREVNACRHLRKDASCQYILRFLGDAPLADGHCLFFELCGRGDLFNYSIDRGGLSEQQARPLFQQMVEAVAALHSCGMAHRDIKLENVMLTHDGSVRLGDFGLATIFAMDGGPVRCHDWKGTDQYVAPEVWPMNRERGVCYSADAQRQGYLAFPGASDPCRPRQMPPCRQPPNHVPPHPPLSSDAVSARTQLMCGRSVSVCS